MEHPTQEAVRPAPGPVLLPDGGTRFRVWAPRCRRVDLLLAGAGPTRMQEAGEGWFEALAPSAGPGTRYRYLLDGERERPDPASRSQPAGVHGPSEVVDPAAFPWTDAGWRGQPLARMVLYELHVGTFTPEGTFDAVIPRLPALADLGVTALELMPVASFPGRRNWGYDGVAPYAPQRSYGGPAGLRRLVDACHRHGLALVLDVVYNHLGPEGNYLAEYGPYFTDRYETPWGQAINFDGADARPVRDFFIANACAWVEEYHVDALRLDAIHGIFDASPRHILAEMNQAVQALAGRLGRSVPLIAESDLNDRRVVEDVPRGYGLAGQWSDDFHHAVHVLLTGERRGYYADFGAVEDLAKAHTHRFIYDGRPSAYRGRTHGTPAADLPAERFVVFVQNHDQVGNRARGERLGQLTGAPQAKLAAAAMLLSPYVPLLFMGEEYLEAAPFCYFTDFTDAALREAVSRGRREEFAAFGWTGEVPDPQDPATFAASRLDWDLRARPPHAEVLAFYRRLLALRREHPALRAGQLAVERLDGATLAVTRRAEDGVAALHLMRFSPEAAAVPLRAAGGSWQRLLDAAEERYGGPGSASPARIAAGEDPIRLGPWASVLYTRGWAPGRADGS
ncbi:MAG: malto-oligosyltrehalose trehalohydrolase [Candidatus Methylomirabilales bacterium]